jgi:hypothetical protein
MATHQGKHSDPHSEQGALCGEHPSRAKNPVIKVLDLTDPSGAPVRVVADTHELATLSAEIADQSAMRSIGYTPAQAAVLRGRP